MGRFDRYDRTQVKKGHKNKTYMDYERTRKRILSERPE